MSSYRTRESRKQALLSEIAERVSQRLDESLILEDFYKSLINEHGFDSQSAQYLVEDVQALSEMKGMSVNYIVETVLSEMGLGSKLRKGAAAIGTMLALGGPMAAQSGGGEVPPPTRAEITHLDTVRSDRLTDLVRSFQTPAGMLAKSSADVFNLDKYLSCWRTGGCGSTGGKFIPEFDPKDSRHYSHFRPSDIDNAKQYFRLKYNEEKGTKPGVAYSTDDPTNRAQLIGGKLVYPE